MTPDYKDIPGSDDISFLSASALDSFHRLQTRLFEEFDQEALNLMTVSFLEYYKDMKTNNRRLLTEKLSAFPLIDVGGGRGDRYLQKSFSIPRYTNVDLQAFLSNESKYRSVHGEMLHYLAGEPAQSSNVMANGTITTDFSRPMAYWSALLKQAYRVVPVGGVFVASHFNLEHIMPDGFVRWTREYNGYTDSQVKVYEKSAE